MTHANSEMKLCVIPQVKLLFSLSHQIHCIVYFTGEIVVFCKPSDMQLKMYQTLLRGHLFRSCLSGSHVSGSPHLICIGALKQLCNHPILLHTKAQEGEEKSHPDVEESVSRSHHTTCTYCKNANIFIFIFHPVSK